MCVSFEPLVDKQVHFNFVFCDDSFGGEARNMGRASNEGNPKVREDFTITEKARHQGRAAKSHCPDQPRPL